MEAQLVIGPKELDAIKENARRIYTRTLGPDLSVVYVEAIHDFLKHNGVIPPFALPKDAVK